MIWTIVLTVFCVSLNLMDTTAVPDVKGPICALRGDPHITSFTSSIHDILPFPCVAQLADLSFSTTGGSLVRVKVYTSSGLATFKGRYFVDYIKVVIIGDDMGGYEAIYESSSTIITNSAPPAWFASGDTLPDHVNVEVDYVVANESAMIYIGESGTGEFKVEITFFPRTDQHPLHRGVIVQASSDIASALPFPSSLCSTFDDFSGTTAVSGPFANDTKLLLAVLGQGTDQRIGVCENSVKTYADCGSTRKTAAAYCKGYLEPKKARCLEDPSTGGKPGGAMSAFLICLKYMCGKGEFDKCDHCVMGPLCDDSDCKTLPALGCSSDDDCLKTATCLSGMCKLKAGLRESCKGCNRVCSNNLMCDTEADHECRIPVGYSGCEADEDCVTSAVCKSGSCKIPVGGSGCVEDEDCVAGAVCKSGSCRIPVGEKGCTEDGHCETGTICHDGKCGIPVGDRGCIEDVHCVTGTVCNLGSCRIPVGEKGCTEDDHCVNGTMCHDGKCGIPVGHSGCTEDVHCVTGAACHVGSCVTQPCEFSWHCGRWLYMTQSTLTFAEGKECCEQCNSTMVMPKTYEEVICVMDFLANSTHSVADWSYVGLERQGEGQFVWQDGTRQRRTGSPWRNGRQSFTGDCGATNKLGPSASDRQSRYVKMSACDFTLHIICEKP